VFWVLPFFYWYQFASAAVATLGITFVYQVTKGRK
jgi:hypothetical protein